jgi:AcrR family transcriptional regulator
MSTGYERGGRTHQKQRTREAMIGAARDLVAQGLTPTVEQAAEAARISRATAYRYFPNQRSLLVAAHPEIEIPSLLPADAPDDPAARLDLAMQALTRMIVDTESQQRTMLRLSLEEDAGHGDELLLRQGRAIRWIEEALAPLENRLSGSELRRLALAIRSAVGIEALVWLTDVAGLDRDEATEIMRWSAGAMLQRALTANAAVAL